MLDSYDILEEKYSYILESMKDEMFLLENPKCNLFMELLFENQVVGFVSYDTENGVGDISLNAIYVLPEFRGNGLLKNTIIGAMENNVSFSIYEPNNLLMDLLIKYGFARKLNEYLIASGISLDIPSESFICNKQGYSLDDEDLHSSNLYDSSISATILLGDISSSPNVNVIYYSRLMDSDIQYCQADQHRNNIDKKHFEKIKYDMINNQDKFTQTLIDLKRNLPKPEYDIYEIVGKPPELSKVLKEIVESGLLSLERAEFIQEQLLDEYDDGEVRNEALLTRFEYLCMEDELEDELPDFFTDGAVCPYCYNPVNLTDSSCTTCGYNIEYEDELDIDLVNEVISELIELVNGDLSNRNNDEFNHSLFEISTGIEEKHSLEEGLTYPDEETTFQLGVIKTLNHFENDVSLTNSARSFYNIYHLDEEAIMDYIIEMGYVDEGITKENWENIAPKFTVAKLKDILRNEGLKISGKKQELIDRIRDNVDVSKINLTDYLDESDCYVFNKKGKQYLLDNRYLIRSSYILEKFDLKEFIKYHDENASKDYGILIMDFLELHEKEALKTRKMDYYENVLLSKRRFLKNNEKYIEEDLFNEITIFVYNLNKYAETFFSFTGYSDKLDATNVQLLRKIYKKSPKSYHKEMIEKICDETDYEKEYEAQDMINILNEIFRGTSLAKIRNNLDSFRQINRLSLK